MAPFPVVGSGAFLLPMDSIKRCYLSSSTESLDGSECAGSGRCRDPISYGSTKVAKTVENVIRLVRSDVVNPMCAIEPYASDPGRARAANIAVQRVAAVDHAVGAPTRFAKRRLEYAAVGFVRSRPFRRNDMRNG